MSLLGSLLGLFGRFSRKNGEPGEEEMWPLDPPPMLEKKFWEVAKLMADEKRQNKKNPPAVRAKILGGPDVDRLPDASGEFGRDPDNPIPVNGVFGELMYLSLLREADTGERLTFHKRGSREGRHGPLDIYETVTLDGKKWDALLLAPHHPRRSRHAPEGYRLADPKPPLFLYGADRRVAGFPKGVTQMMIEMTERMLDVPLVPPDIGQAEDKARFRRPPEHAERLAAALEGAEAEAPVVGAPKPGPKIGMTAAPEPKPAPTPGAAAPGAMPGPMPGMMPGPAPGMPDPEAEPASRPKTKRKPRPKPHALRRKKKKKKRRRK